MDDTARTVPAYFERARQQFPDKPIQEDPQGRVTMTEMLDRAAAAAEGLRSIGVKPGDRVGLLADNSRDWIVADLAIQLARAASVPRGTDTPVEEIAYLFKHGEVEVVFAHDAKQAEALEAIRGEVSTLGEIVCIDPKDAPGKTLDDLVEQGKDGPGFSALAAEVQPDDVATIIYTSGTTGRPKGVVLNQANFGHQVSVLPPMFSITEEEVFLSILPPWHSFERTVEYAALASGSRLAYTDRRRFKEDLRRYRPTFMASVPRLWETVHQGVMKALSKGSVIKRGMFKGAYGLSSAYLWGRDRSRGHVMRVKRPRGIGLLGEGVMRTLAFTTRAVIWPLHALGQKVVFSKIRAATGGRMRGAVSGGGLLPMHIDRFFTIVGVPILVGYGLTETSPVVAARREHRNVLGTIGVAIPDVEVEVRDAETGAKLPSGEVGLIFTRGPHIMQGYHSDPDLTKEVIDENGWFDTGDLGFLTDDGDICFRGRAKETIVLAGGENVEPTHVESALLSSPFIEQAFVVGQDRKTLAALLLPDPETVGAELDLDPVPFRAELAENPDVIKLMHREAVATTSGLAPYERVARMAILPAALDVADGTLTQTLKLKRHVIVERYGDLIERAYGS
jgi:long-chain acyl-CoA synthetase